MKKSALLFLLLLTCTSSATGQKKIYRYGLEDVLDSTFRKAMNGVKYIDFGLNKGQANYLVHSPENADAATLLALISVMKEDRGLVTSVTPEERIAMQKEAGSVCDLVDCYMELGRVIPEGFGLYQIPISLQFHFCDSTIFQVTTSVRVTKKTNIQQKMKKAFRFLLPERNYEPVHRFWLPENPRISRAPGTGKYEGTFQLFAYGLNAPLQVKIASDNGRLLLAHLSGGYFRDDWLEGELLGELRPTQRDGFFDFLGWDSLKRRYSSTLRFQDPDKFVLLRSGAEFTFIRIR